MKDDEPTCEPIIHDGDYGDYIHDDGEKIKRIKELTDDYKDSGGNIDTPYAVRRLRAVADIVRENHHPKYSWTYKEAERP